MSESIQAEIIKKRFFLGVEADAESYAQIPGLPPPSWVREGPLYEVFIRNFSAAGTFGGLTDRVPYLKELGIKTIWLMPIHPIGRLGRKGEAGCPYAIRDHLAINPHYGAGRDLQELITTVHTAGMKLIIDLVINHGALDHVCTSDQPMMFARDEQGQFSRKISEWSDVVDFNYAAEETRAYMLEVMTYWIREFDIDGYRCDVAGMVPLDFWETAAEKILKLKADVLMLAEWQRARLHLRAFHLTYDWITYLILKDIYQDRRPATDILRWLRERSETYPSSALPLLFTENHDHPRTVKVFGRDSFYPYTAMLFALAGVPLLLNGQESGLAGQISLFDHDPVPWDKQNQDIFDFYKSLIQLRRRHPALASGNIDALENNQAANVVTFLKSVAGEEILVTINFSKQHRKIKIALPAEYHSMDWQNLVNNREHKTGQELRDIELKPFGYMFWKRSLR